MVGGDATIRFDGSSLDVSDHLAALGAGKTLTLDLPNTDVSFHTGLAGAGSLVKTGARALKFWSASTLTNASTITVAGGELALVDGGDLGAATVVLDGGSLTANSGVNTFANPLKFGANAAIGSSNSTFTGPVTLLTDSTVTFDGGVILNGVISGAKTLTIAGGSYSQVTLGGVNTYTGGTAITGTTVTLGNSAALSTGPVSSPASAPSSSTASPSPTRSRSPAVPSRITSAPARSRPPS